MSPIHPSARAQSNRFSKDIDNTFQSYEKITQALTIIIRTLSKSLIEQTHYTTNYKIPNIIHINIYNV